MAEVSSTAARLFKKFYSSTFGAAAIGYSRNEELTNQAASGGLVTALLTERLEKGLVRGALVARLDFELGRPVPSTFLARSSDDLLSSAGSIYSDFNHVEGILEVLEKEDGPFDIVALPCQISRLRRILRTREELAGKTALLVGLWCGHATGRNLLETLIGKWMAGPADVSDFRYRTGRWRGRTKLVLGDGRVFYKSFSKGFGLYQNMYADCALRCFSCGDHFGKDSDISFGDCWIRAEKSRGEKRTMALSFTEKGGSALGSILELKSVEVDRIDPVLAVESQKRAIVWQTYSCAARARLGKLFGISIACPYELSPRWNDYVSAFLTLSYYRLFKSRLRSCLFRLPWWALFPLMAFQKLMLNR